MAWLYTSWGASTCRGTIRLLLFQNGKYIGAFNGMDLPGDGDSLKLVGNTIVLQYKFVQTYSDKTEIDLSDGIPSEPGFMPAER